MMKKVLIASGSRHTVPPINSSPGVARIIYALADCKSDDLETYVVSKYDVSLAHLNFDTTKYLHSKPNFWMKLAEVVLDKTPYSIKKKYFGFTQSDRIVYYNSFKKSIKKVQPDVIVTFMHIELFKILKKSFPHVKHVYFYRSTDLKGRLGDDNINFLLKNCDGFLANTKLAVSEFKKLDTLNRVSTKTIYNAVDLLESLNESIEEVKTIERDKLGLAIDDFVIGYAGRFSEEKSLLELLEVLLKMKTKGHIIHLCIAGAIENEKLPNKNYYNGIVSFINKNLKGQVHFLGWVSQEKLHAFYATLDVGVLLSKYREGNSMFMIEALSVGVPMIATNVGGNIEIIENGNFGFLIDKEHIVANLENCLNNLFTDRQQLEYLSKNAIAYIKKEHSFAVMNKRFNSFLKIYDTL